MELVKEFKKYLYWVVMVVKVFKKRVFDMEIIVRYKIVLLNYLKRLVVIIVMKEVFSIEELV